MTPYELYALLRTQLELPADKAREEVAQLVQAIEEAQNGDYEEESLTL
jgi:hypothetical protein